MAEGLSPVARAAVFRDGEGFMRKICIDVESERPVLQTCKDSLAVK